MIFRMEQLLTRELNFWNFEWNPQMIVETVCIVLCAKILHQIELLRFSYSASLL